MISSKNFIFYIYIYDPYQLIFMLCEFKSRFITYKYLIAPVTFVKRLSVFL